MDERLPQPVHDRDDTPPAPADLEPLRSFLSLHDHAPGSTESLTPTTDSLGWWLRANGFLGDAEPASERDLRWALEVRTALVAKVAEAMGEPRNAESTDLLNRAATRAGLRLCFGCEQERPIHVDATGVEGAVGQLLGAAFLAELDGRWERFRLCGEPTCSAVFYDRSRNRSGKWCSMSTCGNRSKVRAFRRRHATA
jgi:predicted RNA-binding Zn ribbon-like protein